MTPAQVRKERERLNGELRRIHAQEKAIIAQIGALEEECKHKKAFKTCHMGEPCVHCPDCNACDV